MNHTVRFIGGPKGGEIQAFPERPPMRIQTLAARDLLKIYSSEIPWSQVDPTYDIEDYEVRRVYAQEGYWEAYWVNPNASLRKQLKDKEGVIERQKFLISSLKEENEAMLPYKNLVDAVKAIL